MLQRHEFQSCKLPRDEMLGNCRLKGWSYCWVTYHQWIPVVIYDTRSCEIWYSRCRIQVWATNSSILHVEFLYMHRNPICPLQWFAEHMKSSTGNYGSTSTYVYKCILATMDSNSQHRQLLRNPHVPPYTIRAHHYLSHHVLPFPC